MRLHKGERVRELTKRVGQIPREGKVLATHGTSVEIQWDDGHISSLSGGLVFPVRQPNRR